MELAKINHRIEGEYIAATDRKRQLLQLCGIEQEDLSKNGHAYLDVLSELAVKLNLNDTRTSSYLTAISDLIEELDDAEQMERELQNENEKLQKRSNAILSDFNDMMRVKKQLQDAVNDRETHENTIMMEQRTAEYAERQIEYTKSLEQLDAILNDSDFNKFRDRVEHHQIVQLESECAAIEKENCQIRDKVVAYHNLPLDIDMVTAMLCDVQTQLVTLEEEFHHHIQGLM